jgi:hypothetical protein
VTSFTYDAAHRLTQETLNRTGFASPRVTFGYDNMDRLTDITRRLGPGATTLNTSLGYDSASRPTVISHVSSAAGPDRPSSAAAGTPPAAVPAAAAAPPVPRPAGSCSRTCRTNGASAAWSAKSRLPRRRNAWSMASWKCRCRCSTAPFAWAGRAWIFSPPVRRAPATLATAG